MGKYENDVKQLLTLIGGKIWNYRLYKAVGL